MTETTGVPDVQKQITGATSGPYDCAVRGGVDWPITWATGKLIKPSDPMAIRKRMGISEAKVGATIDQCKVGYESYQDDALDLGLDLGNLNVRDEGASSTTRDASGIRPALESGHAIVLFVWYGKVNNLVPWASGDHDFNGGHCWTVYDIRPNDDVAEVRVYDPLHDGKGGRPDGPLWIALDDVLACAAAWRKGGDPDNDAIGKGKALYGIAKRATYIEDVEPVPPEPEPPDPLDVAYGALYDVQALGVDIVWPRLVEMAEAGLPPEEVRTVREGAIDP